MAKSQHRLLTQHTENGVIVLTFTEPTLNADAVTEAVTVINGTENQKVILDCQSVRFLVGGLATATVFGPTNSILTIGPSHPIFWPSISVFNSGGGRHAVPVRVSMPRSCVAVSWMCEAGIGRDQAARSY
jgi:hypothetical protein